ncbi:CoA transferase [Planomonospora algeriensis]
MGALEPRFWARMVSLMGLTDLPDREDRANWPALRERLTEAFRSRTRAEWEAVFDGTDACVSPVLDMTEAADHPHNRARGTFVEVDGVRQPAPAPRLLGAPAPDLSPATRLADLSSWGLPDETAAKLRETGVLA